MAQIMARMEQLMGSQDMCCNASWLPPRAVCVALTPSAEFLPKLVGTKPPFRL